MFKGSICLLNMEDDYGSMNLESWKYLYSTDKWMLKVFTKMENMMWDNKKLTRVDFDYVADTFIK